MFGVGLPEMIVIFLVVLLLFGAKSLPDIAKGLGQAMRMFKREMQGIKKDLNVDSDFSQSNQPSKAADVSAQSGAAKDQPLDKSSEV